MDSRLKLAIICATLFVAALEAKKALDPYKVLGVDKTASQREIQKAFHKLSLQYHPDKNKNKGAQEKFAEINNAYELLSDEDKRKNYDLYGDGTGGPFFDGGHAGDYGGNMGGGQGKSHSFSFSFGGPSGGNSFGSGLNDIFSQFFGGGMGGGSNFGGFGGSAGSSSGSKFGSFGGSTSTGSQSGSKTSTRNVRIVTSQLFEKEINNKGITWLLTSYTPSLSLNQHQGSILEEIAAALKGALKVGKVNCGSESSFCKSHGISPRRGPRIFVYSYIKSDSGSFVEYVDDWDTKTLKSFCQEHIPRFSRRVDFDEVDLPLGAGNGLPEVMLLSSKKDTPIIWRALSGLYRKRFVFYDAQVHDVSDPKVKKLGVDALPAVIGWLSNGEKQVLKTGIAVKDLESAVQDLSRLLDSFEKKNKKVVASQAKRPQTEPNQIPILTSSNADIICSDSTPVCIIGVFRSSKSRQKLESILSKLSQMTLSRRRSLSSSITKDSVSYSLLDATKQQNFLNAFDKSAFKSSSEFLLAYKPRRGKYAVLVDDFSSEEVEKFVGSVLSGDVQFSKVKQKPVVK